MQSELPRGCTPRSVEVILRAEAVETAQAGDRSVENISIILFFALFSPSLLALKINIYGHLCMRTSLSADLKLFRILGVVYYVVRAVSRLLSLNASEYYFYWH